MNHTFCCWWRGPWNVLISYKIWLFVYLVVLFRERCSGSWELPKKGTKHSEEWIVWLSFLHFISTLSVSLSCTHTHTRKHLHAHIHRHTHTRRLADDAVLLYFLTLECLCPMIIVNLIDAVTWSVMGFKWLQRQSERNTDFFLEEKRRLSRAGIKKKTPLSD